MENNTYNDLTILVNRLKKIDIDIKCAGNVPWIYLDSVNNEKVKERHNGEHGFTIAWLPMRFGSKVKIDSQSTIIFNILRKYYYITKKTELELCRIAEERSDRKANIAMEVLKERYDKTYMWCMDCDELCIKEKDCCLNRLPDNE